MWIRNTDGKKDAILTMTLAGFLLVVIKIVIAGIAISWGPINYTAHAPGSDVIAAILTPTLGAYVGRRWTDKKHAAPEEPAVTDDDRESVGD